MLFSFVDYVPVKGEIIWYLSLTVWLISLSIMLSSSIHAFVFCFFFKVSYMYDARNVTDPNTQSSLSWTTLPSSCERGYGSPCKVQNASSSPTSLSRYYQVAQQGKTLRKLFFRMRFSRKVPLQPLAKGPHGKSLGPQTGCSSESSVRLKELRELDSTLMFLPLKLQ